MARDFRFPRPWLLVGIVLLVGGLLALLVWLAVGKARPTPLPPTPVPIPSPISPDMAAVAPMPAAEISLALPGAFRYEVTLRLVGPADMPPTVITGQYRDGNWLQAAHSGTQLAEESIVAGDPQAGPAQTGQARHSFTRPAGATVWTRWPGVGFDAAYGLTSPFAVLRLFPLADDKTPAVLEPVPGAPEATFRTQVVVSAANVKRLLAASIAELTPDAETRAVLEMQVALLAVQQTITYWVGEDGRIYRAAATLLATDETGQPAPWLEITWRFWGYDDPSIAIVPPSDYLDAPGLAIAGEPQPTPRPPRTATADGNLVVRVFSAPGVPAEDLAVTVYPAGEARQPLDWRNEHVARFTLLPGRYDVLVQMDYAEEWLRDVTIATGTTATRDVVFDFGVLELTVTREGVTIPVEIVIYPSGDRQNWVDWRSDNPTLFRLRAGTYDVEIAYADYTAKQTVTGLVVRPGEATREAVELKP
jgi:hypothetical protein